MNRHLLNLNKYKKRSSKKPIAIDVAVTKPEPQLAPTPLKIKEQNVVIVPTKPVTKSRRRFVMPDHVKRALAVQAKELQKKIFDASTFTDRVAPIELKHIAGNQKAITRVYNWARSVKQRKNSFPCLSLHGPPGVGKSMSARLALKSVGFTNILEINASEVRSMWNLVERLSELGTQGASFENKTAIVVEELDGIVDSSKKGAKPNNWKGWGAIGDPIKVPKRKIRKKRSVLSKVPAPATSAIQALKDLAKATPLTMVPVIFTANERSKKTVREIMDSGTSVAFYSLHPDEMIFWAKKHLKDIHVDESTLKEMAISSQGDMRAFLNSVEIGMVFGKSETRTSNVFHSLDSLLYTGANDFTDPIFEMMRIYDSDARIGACLPPNMLRFLFESSTAVKALKHASFVSQLTNKGSAPPNKAKVALSSWGTWQILSKGTPRMPPKYGMCEHYVMSRPSGAHQKLDPDMIRLPSLRHATGQSDVELALNLYASPTKQRCTEKPSIYGPSIKKLDVPSKYVEKNMTLQESADPLLCLNLSKEKIKKMIK